MSVKEEKLLKLRERQAKKKDQWEKNKVVNYKEKPCQVCKFTPSVLWKRAESEMQYIIKA